MTDDLTKLLMLFYYLMIFNIFNWWYNDANVEIDALNIIVIIPLLTLLSCLFNFGCCFYINKSLE
jgi:hypothetical protein